MLVSKRIEEICKFIGPCNRLGDVGCDHGYIGLFSIENKLCNSVIATDISKDSLRKAIFNVKGSKFSEDISFRVGPGLEVFKKDEIDVAVIAGMGGNLIRDIIEESLDIFKSMDYLVLQPVQNVEVVRKYIYEKGYNLIEEKVVYDEEKYYPIIKVSYGENEKKSFSDIVYELGEKVICSPSEEELMYIKHKINHFKEIISYITKETEAALIRKKEIQDKINFMESILNENK
ncbi:class I SAM-dependent methyltransferase [Clostridium bornimense]|uniref:tRNA (adenine(22)-N(1))-methyltransferase n=1 Tax=Clostridium bornimense TaxID=1216932 RepID=UPI001C110F8E|nr:class I SAM-dependent methyltransferase [Clostridium bornimense]MBU5314701.1 class I SAM-dependent methyltransferase [Clostridium bornimense]